MTKSAKAAKNPGAKIEKAKSIKGAGGKRAAGDLPKVKLPLGGDNPLSPSGSGSLSSHSPLTNRQATKLWFQAEISSMMYAFGDCRKPCQESVALVEDIVRQQMSNLLVQTADVTSMRGGKFMSIDDILFLLKRNKEKLRRVIRYLDFRDSKIRATKSASQDEDEVLESAVGDTGKSDNKRLKLAYDFISSIDNTGELTALFDQDGYEDRVRQERLERAERLAKSLDRQSYVEYTEARQVNFNKKAGKFKEWLDVSSLIDVKPSGAVMEILSYMAYETVGQIVDLALIVKQDQEVTDPVKAAMPPSINPETNLMKIFSIAGQKSLSTSAAPTPGHTPPGTPTAAQANSGNSTNNASSTGTGTSLIAPAQGSLASSLGTASLASSGLIKPSKTKKKKTKFGYASSIEPTIDSIQPSHIREAMRRYFQSHGAMTPFSSNSRPSLGQRTLCL
ncbi:transcription initiation protein SPT3 homolog [Rhopilema esculentum]|uniref:transcription initiation protein SPT3 homolog n=1 Tax=Rhopilema esculentum TaxID=499914 RepID=UPI0031D3A374